MDLSDPSQSITPTLDGPVLVVLAHAGHPLTVGQIAERVTRGSLAGVRRTVSRLVEQGLVTAIQMGRNAVHELNRDHLAAPAALAIADIRPELWRRLRLQIEGWKVQPVYAAVFGSAARGDGTIDSDIDLLLVRDRLNDEVDDGPPSPSKMRRIREAWSKTPGFTALESAAWQSQLDQLHRLVQSWTGNLLHVVDVSTVQWARLPETDPALGAAVREGPSVELAGSRTLHIVNGDLIGPLA